MIDPNIDIPATHDIEESFDGCTDKVESIVKLCEKANDVTPVTEVAAVPDEATTHQRCHFFNTIATPTMKCSKIYSRRFCHMHFTHLESMSHRM